jgi:hypothetical protein
VVPAEVIAEIAKAGEVRAGSDRLTEPHPDRFPRSCGISTSV